ncbi:MULTISPECIES: RIP metalloprotease RseP [Proteiniphilum]|jgi:regulator of sigma E protease|uniref:RIP metalloprotease RseP n=1 Tax=Proteiniphilum TaxID=294702 RepID=UPI001EEA909A|nr:MULTISPECIES: RIP metalloprotease RseP [Proteiniphilum]MDD2247858.1 RIP metalloprotease RseP [Proteiniphilum sp.]ULB34392.1 RIP metalloprotease RseP [Proteiniphilum propionicum]
METFLIKALQLILSLSILVIVHEFGHYIFARMFKIRVEKFYLFFDPWFAILRYKPRNSQTEYGIGWLPLGGYVKIAGMIDESMDKEQMALPAQPWEFRSKPAWQRLMVMVAGVLFNLLLAFFIYSMVLFTWSDTYLPLKNVTQGMEFSQAAHSAGFQDGDILLRADNKELERFGVRTLLDVADAEKVTVLRNGEEVILNMSKGLMENLLKDKEGFATYRIPAVVYLTMEGSAAQRAGLIPGDSIVGVNGIITPVFGDLRSALDSNRNQQVTLDYYRNGVLYTTTAGVDSAGTLGFYAMSAPQIYRTVTLKYSFFESLPAGIRLGIQTLKDYVAQFKYVFTKEGASSLGGFGAIGNLFPAQWNWQAFWMMTAFLSVILAFMNILPIPALDGGHVMFLIYEVIVRRKPNEKFMEYAQVAGMMLLLGLVLYANGMDVVRAIFK